ncbi:MAG: ABC transporter permease, partial [Pseudomonadota bacterium]
MTDIAGPARRGGGHLRTLRHVFAENPLTLFALVLFVLLVAAAVFGELIAPYDPLATNSDRALEPPSFAHPFGTDHLGRDVLSRVIVAARIDLGIAVCAVALSFGVGLLLGAYAGYFGGWTDRIVGRFVD